MDIENAICHDVSGNCCRNAIDTATNYPDMLSGKSVCKGFTDFLIKYI